MKKFKINVTSHLKTIIFIIKDIQILKCDIIFKMADFRPLRGRGKGGRVSILSHPYGVFCHAFQIMSQGVYGCYNYSIAH